MSHLPITVHFVKDEAVADALRGLQDAGVQLENEEKPCDLDYAGYRECPTKSTKQKQLALERLMKAVATFGMCFALPYYKVLL